MCLVFDVSNRDSFESCGRWLQGVRAALPAASAPLPGVLIANKADLREGGINARAVVDTKVPTYSDVVLILRTSQKHFQLPLAERSYDRSLGSVKKGHHHWRW